MKSSSGTSGAFTARAKAARSASIGKVVRKVSSGLPVGLREEEGRGEGGESLPSGSTKSVSMSGKGSRCWVMIAAEKERCSERRLVFRELCSAEGIGDQIRWETCPACGKRWATARDRSRNKPCM